VTDDIDLIADLNAEDDDGLGWSTLADARTPDRIAPGAMFLAGNRLGQAVVRIVAVDDDGQVHSRSSPARWPRTVTCLVALSPEGQPSTGWSRSGGDGPVRMNMSPSAKALLRPT
jgi:hypothetical protein